jgi:8-oxo-dGTP pyrophosphatase MutT (NUDIX family)
LEAAVRETREECAIELPPESLQLVGITTFFPSPDEQHHGIIYLAPCPSAAECVLNEEHVGFRWVRPGYYVSRFLSEERLVAAGLAEPLLRTTRETRRVAEVVIALLAGEAAVGPHSP